MVEPHIFETGPADDALWDRVVSQCDYATFFHSREWAEIWSAYTDRALRPAALEINFSDGRRALFPRAAARRLNGVLTRYHSSPDWTFGGWLSLDRLSCAHHRAMWRLASRLDLKIRRNPFDPLLEVSDVRGIQIAHDFTQVLDLRSISMDAQGWTCAELPHKARGQMRSSIRKARAAGVSVREAKDIDAWRRYFALYERSQERWESVLGEPHRFDLFRILCERRSPNIKLWLAELDGEAVCGAVLFYNNKHAVYWHGASHGDYAALSPGNLLQAHLIGDAFARGFTWYDFNPSGGLAGVERFKASFGATRLPAEIVTCRNRRRRAVDAVRSRMAARQSSAPPGPEAP